MMGEKPDEFIRTPMQWTDDPDTAGFTTGMAWEAIGESFTEANVAVEDSDPDSLLNHYRTLIHLRNDSPALRYGDLTFVEASERPIYSFIRHTGDETLLVVINLNFREIEDYELSLEAFSLDDSISATLLLGDGEFSAPTVNAEGGFDAYTPIDLLPPRSSFIIALSTP
jgi:glycosidase